MAENGSMRYGIPTYRYFGTIQDSYRINLKDGLSVSNEKVY